MSKNVKKLTFLTAAALLILAALFTGCDWFNASARVEKQLELGVKYLSENKYEEAVLAYREVIKIDKKNVPAYKGLSIAYSLQSKPDQAEQALQDGLKQTAGSVALKLALAGLFVDHNKKDQAEALYNEIIAKEGNYLPAYQAYARLLISLNRQNDAVALLEKAAAGNAGQYIIYSLLAEQYMKAGNRDKALAAISQSLAAESSQAASYKLLAELYSGRWNDLIALGDQYIQQGRNMPGQIIKLTGLYQSGKYDDMVKLYNQLPSDQKASPKIRLLAAQAYVKLGQKDQGISLVKDIKPESIKDAALMAEIANFCLEAGDKETARGLALKGISLDDTVIDNYIVLSKSYQDEDQSQSNIWLTKYVLGSAYGVTDAKKEQKAGLEEKKPVVANVPEVSQKISLEEVYRYLPSQQYKIRQTLWCDLDNDGVEELAIVTGNFELPYRGNPNEDNRYMVFKKAGNNVIILADGKMPGALNGKPSTFKIGARAFLVINDWYGGDGAKVALALTMKNGSLIPVWKGSEFKDTNNDGILEGIYYNDVFKWDEGKQYFLNNKGETTAKPLE